MSRLVRLQSILRPAYWLFLSGAVIGSALDALQVYGGVERYPLPTLLGLAYWLPCLYACASLAIGDLGRSLLQREDYHARPTRPHITLEH